MDERRKEPRQDVAGLGLKVFEYDGDQPLGVVGNLSLGGMMMIAYRRLCADGVMQLKMECPQAEGPGFLALGVKVLWCSPASSQDIFWAGLQIIDIDSSTRLALENLLIPQRETD